MAAVLSYNATIGACETGFSGDLGKDADEIAIVREREEERGAPPLNDGYLAVPSPRHPSRVSWTKVVPVLRGIGAPVDASRKVKLS